MPTQDEHFRMVSEAVQAWHRYYEVEPDDQSSHTLSAAAIEFFQNGHHSLDDVTTMLIGTYVGKWSARVNAPTSTSVH